MGIVVVYEFLVRLFRYLVGVDMCAFVCFGRGGALCFCLMEED